MMQRSLCYLLALLLLPGCSFIRDPTWVPSDPNEYGIIGILENAVTPDVHIPAPIKDYGAGMAVGAVIGMVAWNSPSDTPTEVTEDTSSSGCKDADGIGKSIGCVIVSAIVGAVASLVMTVVAGGVGAIWGGVKTAAGYGPQPAPIAEAQQRIDDTATDAHLQSEFITHMQSMIDARFRIPTALYYQPSDHPLTAEGVFAKSGDASTVLQAWIESINFKQLSEDENSHYSLIVRVRANTYRRDKNRPVDVHHFEWEGAGYSVETWGENEAGLLKTEIQKSYQEIGEQIVTRSGFRREPHDQSPPVLDTAVAP